MATPVVDPDLIVRRSDVAALEQVDDAPVPPVQLDLRVAGALSEGDEFAGGSEPGAQILRRPKHDVRGRERDGERAGIRERARRRDRLLDERPSARLGRRVGKRDTQAWRAAAPEAKPRCRPRRSSASSRSATSDSSTRRSSRASPAAPSAARASRSSRAPRGRVAPPPRSQSGRIGLARTQARLAERDEHLGQPSGRRASAGESPRRARAVRSRPPRPAARRPVARRPTRRRGQARGRPGRRRARGVRAAPASARATLSARSASTSATRRWGRRAARPTTARRARLARARARTRAARSRQLRHQARPQGVVERVQHRLLRLARSRPHELHVELGAGDCGELEQPSCALAGADRHVQRRSRSRRPGPGRDPPCPGVLGQLADEERIPTGSLAQGTGGGPIWARPRQRLHDGGNGRVVEPRAGPARVDRPVAPYLGERLRERVARVSLDVPRALPSRSRGRAEAVWPGGAARSSVGRSAQCRSSRASTSGRSPPRPRRATRRRRRTFGPGRPPGRRPARPGGPPRVPRGRPRGRQGP